MCGFAGFVSKSVQLDAAYPVLERMGKAIRHRGPDDSGIWVDPESGVGLVHQRLSIVDLSAAGRQPMHSASNRFVIAFNGEIYNHLELRAWLANETGQSPAWRGHSDTESLLACIEAFGFEKTLQRSVGMFAMALWDRKLGTLSLARDRLGEKPLYYGWIGNTLLFASELHAIRAHPQCSPQISRGALSLFMRFGYVPTPYSILEGINKLPPGSWICFSSTSISNGTLSPAIPYWSLQQVVRKGNEQPFNRGDELAVNTLSDLLTDAIQLQQVADVPLGAFLSGGVDSSLIVSLMQAQSSRPVNTYTIGFEEEEFNEANHAAAVARHLGTQHHEVYLSGADALKVIPKLSHIYDEPFADPSQVPTRLVCEVARGSVTVALSGDAGDELFGGYNRYLMAGRLWSRMSKVPRPLRRSVAGIIGQVSPQSWGSLYGAAKGLLPSRWQVSQPSDKIHKLIEMLSVKDRYALYKNLVSQWKSPENVVLGGNPPDSLLDASDDFMPTLGFEEWMMLMDAQTYLPDDILLKMDRAAMSVSLETRVPLLDHRVVEFAAHLPLDMKIRNDQGKWILRQILYRHVPREMIERPKTGFAIPLGQWMRGPLRDWAETLLAESRLISEGFFNAGVVRQRWKEHLSGHKDWQSSLWTVLMFQSWLDNFNRKQS
jgi:asparagine synthase (glutamine-hydrolysing)